MSLAASAAGTSPGSSPGGDPGPLVDVAEQTSFVAALTAVYQGQLARARVARASLLFVATLQSLGILVLVRGVVDNHNNVTKGVGRRRLGDPRRGVRRAQPAGPAARCAQGRACARLLRRAARPTGRRRPGRGCLLRDLHRARHRAHRGRRCPALRPAAGAPVGAAARRTPRGSGPCRTGRPAGTADAAAGGFDKPKTKRIPDRGKQIHLYRCSAIRRSPSAKRLPPPARARCARARRSAARRSVSDQARPSWPSPRWSCSLAKRNATNGGHAPRAWRAAHFAALRRNERSAPPRRAATRRAGRDSRQPSGSAMNSGSSSDVGSDLNSCR